MKKKLILPTILIILFFAIGCVSLYKIISTTSEYREARNEYNELKTYAKEKENLDIPDGTVIIPQSNVDKIKETVPLDIDWNELKSINEDIVGWLYIKSIDISYPIVKGSDNNYYLHRTFRNTYNFAGSIFMEYQNDSSFNSLNTILYGHNMKDGSMFGKLSWIKSKELYKEDPYFWILTPFKNYKYQIFSTKTVGVYDDSYMQFSVPDEEFIDWIKKMKDSSGLDIDSEGLELTKNVVTLSTCTGNDSTRFIVQGYRVLSI